MAYQLHPAKGLQITQDTRTHTQYTTQAHGQSSGTVDIGPTMRHKGIFLLVPESKYLNGNSQHYTFGLRCHITQETVKGHVDASTASPNPVNHLYGCIDH